MYHRDIRDPDILVHDETLQKKVHEPAGKPPSAAHPRYYVVRKQDQHM